MNTTIKSSCLTASVDSMGAGLTSIKRDGIEYLWQADATYWGGQAPVMFPICGCLRNDEATLLNGKKISLPRHGFARRREFTVTDTKENEVTLTLNSDEETMKVYPFSFIFQMNYKIEGNHLFINHIVTNNSDEDMPYFVGGHPAFFCPQHENEVFEDYVVEMSQEETKDCPLISESGELIEEKRTMAFDHTAILPVKHELFYHDALCLEYPKSTSAILRHKDSDHGVRVDFEGFDFFQIWSSANDGPFVALEPWTGTATTSKEDNIFEHKRGVKICKPGEIQTTTYSISIV